MLVRFYKLILQEKKIITKLERENHLYFNGIKIKAKQFKNFKQN